MYYEGLQDKLAQVRDARAALNALRDEHREKLRRAAEEAERQRQIQLAQKLEIMRQKKQVMNQVLHWEQKLMRCALSCWQVLAFVLQEYLEMQRQLAIQRLQEQEKERQMRLEQQKHTIQMRAQMPAFSLPYAQVHTAYWSTGFWLQDCSSTERCGSHQQHILLYDQLLAFKWNGDLHTTLTSL